jgi:hypothetical protein
MYVRVKCDYGYLRLSHLSFSVNTSKYGGYYKHNPFQFKKETHNFASKIYIYVFRLILKINSDYFPKYH